MEPSKVDKAGALIKKQWFIQARAGKIEDHYDFNKDKDALGSGTYGSVFKATLKGTDQVRAIKHIPKVRVKNQERFKTEIDIMRNLDHPSIIKLYETYEDAANVFLVMEVCSGGELFDRIVSKGYFSEAYARSIFLQIVRAIHYCHGNKISHRDLKPENFLFLTKDEDSVIKMIDFGLSKFFGGADTTAPKPGGGPAPVEEEKKPGQRRAKKTQMQTKAGTPYYIAPEVLTGSYDETCDIWSAGVILYILLCGYPPFYGDSDGQILDSVKRGSYDFSGPEWKNVSENAKDLIRKMLTKPESRLHANQVLKHPWCLAHEEAMPKAVISTAQLKQFQGHKTLKKAALTYIASQVGESEISNLRKMFEKLDSNGDGVLTFDELKAGVEDASEKNVKELQTVMDSIDTDQNGFINYTEFLAAMLDKKIYNKDDKLKAAFKIFDKDGDGKITAKDLKDVIGGEEKKGDDYWETLIKEGDEDKDGAINFKDFVSLMEH